MICHPLHIYYLKTSTHPKTPPTQSTSRNLRTTPYCLELKDSVWAEDNKKTNNKSDNDKSPEVHFKVAKIKSFRTVRRDDKKSAGL